MGYIKAPWFWTIRIVHGQKIPSHQQKDKKTGGYVMGQSIVLLLLVTPKITLPVGFSFYQPDPTIKAWVKENKRLKSTGVLKKESPKAPQRAPKYPTKQDMTLSLLKPFGDNFPEIHVQCILAIRQ